MNKTEYKTFLMENVLLVRNEKITIEQIVKQNAKFVRRSGFNVTFDDSFSWIAAKGKDDELFFQGEEADNLLKEATELYQKTDTYFDDCLSHVIKPWIENI